MMLDLTDANITCLDASKYAVQTLYVPKKIKFINLGDSSITTLYLDNTPEDQKNLGLGMGASSDIDNYIKEIDVTSSLFTNSKSITKEGITIYRDSSATDFCSDKVVPEEDKNENNNDNTSNNNQGTNNDSTGNGNVNVGTNTGSSGNGSTKPGTSAGSSSNVETTVKNPPTGYSKSVIYIFIAALACVGYLLVGKKNSSKV